MGIHQVGCLVSLVLGLNGPPQTGRMTRRHLIAALAFATLGIAHAAPIAGRVVQVIDGDTIVVRSAGGTEHRVRIAGAEAQERGQAYSAQAKRRAESELLGRGVTVGRDGQVERNGKDVAETLIRDGAAWHDKDASQTPSTAAKREKAQREAQERRAGLWAKGRPEEPRLLRERREGRSAHP